MAGRAALRASDNDRDRIADRLREAAAEGRLLIEELEQRLGSALSARTYGELEALIADLPGPRLLTRPRRRRSRMRLLPRLGLVLGAILIAPIVLASIALAIQLALGVILVWWIWAVVAWLAFGRVRRRWGRAYYWRGAPLPSGPRGWRGSWRAEWHSHHRA
jgi:hypothetical protein